MAAQSAKMLEKPTEELCQAFEVEKLPFRRNLSHEEIRKLKSACERAFGAVIHNRIMEKIMTYCCHVERRMQGRAAGNIEDLIIRYLTRYYASFLPDELENTCHMEIGALFGAASIYSCHATALAGKKIPTVVIDPFEGYYGQEKDVVTHQRIDEHVFWSNIEQFGYSRNWIEVKKGFSTDEQIINSLKKYHILSLLIDGDHSYQGVKKDWLTYSPLVVPGGYVLIDDYNSHDWPEVSAFVNKEILSTLLGRWEVVLVFGSSIILKRIDDQKYKEQSKEEMLFHQLKDRERAVEQKKEEIRLQDERIRQKDEQIRQKEEIISNLKNTINRMENTLSWKITAPLRWFTIKSNKK